MPFQIWRIYILKLKNKKIYIKIFDIGYFEANKVEDEKSKADIHNSIIKQDRMLRSILFLYKKSMCNCDTHTRTNDIRRTLNVLFNITI